MASLPGMRMPGQGGLGAGGKDGLAGLTEMLGPDADAKDVASMEAMWKMLDSMAESDPDQYSRFIKEQMAAGKQQEAEDRKARTFTPSPGFVVATELQESQVLGQPCPVGAVFANVCFDERADSAGDDSAPSVSVGARRHDKGKARTVWDVVVAPAVVQRARQDVRYKRYCADVVLALLLPREQALHQQGGGTGRVQFGAVNLPALQYKAGKVPQPHVLSLPPRPAESTARSAPPAIQMPRRGGDSAPLITEASSGDAGPSIAEGRPSKKSGPLIAEVQPSKRSEPLIAEVQPSKKSEPLIAEVQPSKRSEPLIAEVQPSKRSEPLIAEVQPSQELEAAPISKDAEWVESVRVGEEPGAVVVELCFRVPRLRTSDLDVGVRDSSVRVELLPTAEQSYLGWRCAPVDVQLPVPVDVGAGAASMRRVEGKRVLRLHLPR